MKDCWAGQTCVISDAGTPALSDGLAFWCARLSESGITVLQCLPGATAFVPTTVAWDCRMTGSLRRFHTAQERKATRLEGLKDRSPHDDLYESPYRLVKHCSNFQTYSARKTG